MILGKSSIGTNAPAINDVTKDKTLLMTLMLFLLLTIVAKCLPLGRSNQNYLTHESVYNLWSILQS